MATVLGRVTLTAPRESLVPPLQQPERAPVVTIHKEKPDISGQQLNWRMFASQHSTGIEIIDGAIGAQYQGAILIGIRGDTSDFHQQFG